MDPSLQAHAKGPCNYLRCQQTTNDSVASPVARALLGLETSGGVIAAPITIDRPPQFS